MESSMLSFGSVLDPSLTEKAKKKIKKKKRKRAASSPEPMKPGIVYIGHIPHGFYESEMKGYFSQFGSVKRVKVARSKKTGGCKGYAFVQFACDEVAKIVAQTMNNYLMFNKLLKCQFIEPAQVHKGMLAVCRKNLRNLTILKRRRQAQRLHNKGRNMSQHRKRISRLLTTENKKRERIKEAGIVYDFPGYSAAAESSGEHREPSHITFTDEDHE